MKYRNCIQKCIFLSSFFQSSTNIAHLCVAKGEVHVEGTVSQNFV